MQGQPEKRRNPRAGTAGKSGETLRAGAAGIKNGRPQCDCSLPDGILGSAFRNHAGPGKHEL